MQAGLLTPRLSLVLIPRCRAAVPSRGPSVIQMGKQPPVPRRCLPADVAFFFCTQGKKGDAGPPGTPGSLGPQVTAVPQLPPAETLLCLSTWMRG